MFHPRVTEKELGAFTCIGRNSLGEERASVLLSGREQTLGEIWHFSRLEGCGDYNCFAKYVMDVLSGRPNSVIVNSSSPTTPSTVSLQVTSLDVKGSAHSSNVGIGNP